MPAHDDDLRLPLPAESWKDRRTVLALIKYWNEARGVNYPEGPNPRGDGIVKATESTAKGLPAKLMSSMAQWQHGAVIVRYRGLFLST